MNNQKRKLRKKIHLKRYQKESKYMQHLYTGNYKMLLKEIEKDINE